MVLIYLGPGIGGGLIALILAFLLSFVTFIIAIVWYPIKKIVGYFKKIKNK